MKKFLLAMFLTATSWCWAQMGTPSYTTAASVAWPSNDPNCAVGHNTCWHLGTYTLNSISSGGDGYTAGLNSSGQIIAYADYPSNSWSPKTSWGSGWSNLAVGSATKIYAIKNANSCGASAPDIWSLNVSTGTWSNQGFCGSLLQLSAAADGTAAVVRTDGNIWTNLVPGWGAITTGGGYVWASLSSGTLLVAAKGNGTVWKCNPSSCTMTQISGISNAIQVSIDQFGVLYALGSDGYVYHYNGTSWTKLAGSGNTSLANGGPLNVWAVGPTQSGSNVWRFPTLAMQFGLNLSGSSTCMGGNCGSVLHYNSVNGSLSGTTKHDFGGTVQLTGVPPTTQVNLTSYDTAWDMWDSCFTNPQPGACSYPNGWSTVTCSQAGQVYSGLPNPLLDCRQIPSLADGWDSGSNIRVYIDTDVAQPNDAIWKGIQNGLWGWESIITHPWYMSFTSVHGWPTSQTPYLYIHNCNCSRSSTAINAAHTISEMKLSMVGVNSSNISGLVAHEEGHNNRLGDCDLLAGCFLLPGMSVMGPQPSLGFPVQPPFARPCDIMMANTYGAGH